MMKKSIFFLSLLFLFITGCVMSPENNSEQDEIGRTISPRTTSYKHSGHDEGNVNDYGRKLQKEQLSTNEFDSYTDPTTTDKSEQISQKLMENRDIIMAEVHELDDQIYVAVRLRENVSGRSHKENVIPEIEKQVREVIGADEKQLIIWTDHTEWNEYKNEEAEFKPMNSFDKFFERE
ncbi:YhcN/YlaJ family sporulation lipoprotein [Oceanobacillus alkalisoli]|uniref:YhcN/YlaJ family sporulation lipoprotein n=1 Tax=Oceanobacillus alkalisoli TaxID=2925113 RepID=UPI001EEF89EC|nr:YhcN/YlaJ family sporulation lipoprotein [Oceanobacillus alkalisoli]MCF3941876.1 YhcN/YlaJ family sporulation lipoprotein [Oceanobacillus alkalisoli]MCG5104251.1 YhcN/YlaJ family sporulation lipoprotein [Oceanobacillus alkalisoli]